MTTKSGPPGYRCAVLVKDGAKAELEWVQDRMRGNEAKSRMIQKYLLEGRVEE